MTLLPRQRILAQARVLVVGCGGLAAPATRALVTAGLGALTLLDDDSVAATNLHRQTLFSDADEGRLKVEAAADTLRALGQERGTPLSIESHVTRLLPDDTSSPNAKAASLVAGHDLVLDGTDNLASKFLIADAARLAGVPAVHAGVVRWTGWALAAAGRSGCCMRCVFEDLPDSGVETCAAAGVVGPVVGVVGALEAKLALSLLEQGDAAAGQLISYDALRGRVRHSRVRSRPGCALCDGRILDLDLSRYMPRSPSPSTQEIMCP